MGQFQSRAAAHLRGSVFPSQELEWFSGQTPRRFIKIRVS